MHCAATFNQLAEPISYQIIHNINNDRPVQRQFSNLTVSILAVSKLTDSILAVSKLADSILTVLIWQTVFWKNVNWHYNLLNLLILNSKHCSNKFKNVNGFRKFDS